MIGTRDSRTARARRRRRERETARLVRRLERAHGLRRRQARLLREIARYYGLPTPAPLYFRPSLLAGYAEAVAGRRQLARSLAARDLLGVLFEGAPAARGAGAPPHSFTPPATRG